MKIFKYIKYKNKAEKKALMYSALIFILIGQIVALIYWYFFKDNYFLILLFGSIVGFLFGYRGLKKV
jgi:fatty acid desaturase